MNDSAGATGTANRFVIAPLVNASSRVEKNSNDMAAIPSAPLNSVQSFGKPSFTSRSTPLPLRPRTLISAGAARQQSRICSNSTPRHIQPARNCTPRPMMVVPPVAYQTPSVPISTAVTQYLYPIQQQPMIVAQSMMSQSVSSNQTTNSVKTAACTQPVTESSLQFMPMLASSSTQSTVHGQPLMLNMVIPQNLQSLQPPAGAYIMQPNMTTFITTPQRLVATPFSTFQPSSASSFVESTPPIPSTCSPSTHCSQVVVSTGMRPTAPIVSIQAAGGASPLSKSTYTYGSTNEHSVSSSGGLFGLTRADFSRFLCRPELSNTSAFEAPCQLPDTTCPQSFVPSTPVVSRVIEIKRESFSGAGSGTEDSASSVSDAVSLLGDSLINLEMKKKRGRPPKHCSGGGSDGKNVLAEVNENAEEMLNGSVQLKKQISVKSERIVITHVIDGMLIYESNEPFPVKRSSILTEPLIPTKCSTQKSVDTQGSCGAATPPVEGGINIQNMGLPVSALIMNSVGSMKCEFCHEFRPFELFKASRRFCSVSCARKYNVSRKIEKNRLKKEHQMDVIEAIPATKDSMDSKVSLARSLSSVTNNLVPMYSAVEQVRSTESHSASVSSNSCIPQLPSAASADMQVHLSNQSRKLATWTTAEVHAFVRDTPGCEHYAALFYAHEIDGEALLLLKEEHLMQPPISMKLGPALKLGARIEENRT